MYEKRPDRPEAAAAGLFRPTGSFLRPQGALSDQAAPRAGAEGPTPGSAPPRPEADHARPPEQPTAALPPGVLAALASPGRPLDAATRGLMERRFGWDFGAVCIHADAEAAASAASVYARAYTVGRHIVLGAGQPPPGSLAGRALLAHELAHVVQQARGGPGLPAPEVSPSAPHEREARAAAVAV